MRVLLISANTEMIHMPVLPLGLACIARAAEQAGHLVRIINLMAKEDVNQAIAEAIGDFDPQVIGISVRNIDDQVMAAPRFLLEPVRQMIAFCRTLTDRPIILGGAGYSIFPQSALDYLQADAGIQGEGEQVFVRVLERLEKGANLSAMSRVYLPANGPRGPVAPMADLDDLSPPLPGIHLGLPEKLNKQEIWLPFQTRRGCPMGCSYCSTALIEGRRLRRRQPKRAAEILSWYAAAGFGSFFFVDNTFNLPPGYAKDLCDCIAALGLKVVFRCILHPFKVDEELVEKMAAAGCIEVSLGFESGSAAILRQMGKKHSLQDVRRISEILKQYGIRRTGFLLLGGPGEDQKTVQESLEFAASLNLEAMKITTGIRIYPHTELARLAQRQGRLRPGEDLLLPKFYMVDGLWPWLQETVASWMKDRPHWFT
jgi:radical SAM superfamily enzyme YgiQ (UPF0313 family)